MKNIIFIEGVSGVGKSTSAALLGVELQKLGYSVSCHLEGDADNPLDLCWAAYLTRMEFENLLVSHSECADELIKNVMYDGDYILLRYQISKPHEIKRIFSSELHDILHRKEFCYNPTNVVPISKFIEVFMNRWKSFAESDEANHDYAIFDASLVSHMTNDLMHNYNASADDIVQHLEALLQTIRHLNPVLFYLSSQNVRECLANARMSRGQSPPTDEQIAFWEKRKEMDLSVLPRLSVDSYSMDISDENWDAAVSEMISRIVNLTECKAVKHTQD